jgi:hypothetical protein
MLGSMIPEAQRLHASLVSAFPAYAIGKFSDRGYPLDRATVEAIEAATAQLDLDLAAELERPFVEQRRTPLEVFSSALDTLTPILASHEIEEPADARDGDRYALAPGSSGALGDVVRGASLAWGAAKSAAFTGGDPRGPHRPVVVVMTMDRGAREELCHAAEEAGYDCVAARNPSAVAEAIASSSVRLALVDLAHRAAYDAVERLGNAGVSTIVFGAGVDDLTETGLRAAGVRAVVERDQLLRAPQDHLPRIS